ncbi:fimbrial protein [Haemophilus paracuniculus]|uniref:Fimbrial protein n=1 Tax=Haemophilus paracuniculus TaxID=734 RepID=A0A1T0AU25_9PAST|nr:type II secretion system F family protein [Haemophilus paracuniculus]OOS00265.1 fimbrial protein [Haemophilus paracuniculus]
MNKVYEYQWKGINRFQQKQGGRLLSISREKVESELISQGYSNIKISRNFSFSSKPKSEEISKLLTQFSLLLSSKIQLKKVLEILLKGCLNKPLYLWLNEVKKLIESGFSFSEALDKTNQNGYLKSQEIQLIKIGEVSGRLAEMMKNIAQYREKSDKMNKKVKKILFYPLFILSISLIISIFLLISIVPQFADLYQSKGQNLPFITEMLFSLSSFLQEKGKFLLISSFVIIILIKVLAKKTTFIYRLKFSILSCLPLLNQIISFARIIYFSQSLALMLNAKVRIDVALSSFLTKKGSDPILEKEIDQILSLLKQGYQFSDGLNSVVFTDEVVQMVSVAEKSGNLAEMLAYISENYQTKLDYQIDILSQLLEPMLMLLMGLIVGVIITGLYLPIFDMGAIIE